MASMRSEDEHYNNAQCSQAYPALCNINSKWHVASCSLSQMALSPEIISQDVRNRKVDHRQRTTAQPLCLPPWPGPPLSRIEAAPPIPAAAASLLRTDYGPSKTPFSHQPARILLPVLHASRVVEIGCSHIRKPTAEYMLPFLQRRGTRGCITQTSSASI